MLKKVWFERIVMEGFMGEKEVREEKFDKTTILVGANGAGKSTVANACSWAVTGKLFEGDKLVSNGFLNKESTKSVVELYFKDETGAERVIKRSFTVASGVSIWLDKKPITQKALNKVIDPDTFLMVFNPISFLGKKPTEARNLIMNLIDTSAVTNDDVIDKMTANDVNNIAGIDLEKAEAELKKIRKTVSDKEKDIVVLEGYITKNNKEISDMTIPEKKAPADTKALKGAEKKLNDIIKKKPDMSAYTELLNKKGEIEKHIAEINASTFDKTEAIRLQQEKKNIEKEIEEAKKLEFSPSNLYNLQVELKQHEKDIYRLQSENSNLKVKIIKVRKQYSLKLGDNCPVCNHKLDNKGIDSAKNFVNNLTDTEMQKGVENKATIEGMEKDVKALLEKIENIKKEDEKNKKEFETKKAQKISQLEAKVKEISAKIEALKVKFENFEADKANKVKQLQEQIDKMDIANAKKDLDEYEDKVKVQREQVEAIQKEHNDIAEFNKTIDTSIERKNKLAKEVAEYEVKITNVKSEISEVKNVINSITAFNQTRIRLIEEVIKKHFNKVSFKVEKVNEETGEITPCFEVLYDNKNIITCSLSEQVKAGVEITEMVQNTLGINYPLFLDNNESVIEVKTLPSQVIRAIVINVPKVTVINEEILNEVYETAKNIVLKAS